VFDSGDRIIFSAPARPEQSVVSPDLTLSNFVELWCTEGFAYFVGLKGRTLWYANGSTGELASTIELDRLDLRGAYDPGGLHRVEFHELSDGDLLIVYEFGLARLSSDGKARWQQVHDQASSHFERVANGVVWFRGEYEPFGFNLEDGHPIVANGT
jgi:hypothetical protein